MRPFSEQWRNLSLRGQTFRRFNAGPLSVGTLQGAIAWRRRHIVNANRLTGIVTPTGRIIRIVVGARWIAWVVAILARRILGVIVEASWIAHVLTTGRV